MSSELEIYRFKTGHYIATNDDYEFIIKTGDFVKWHIFQVIGNAKNELGSAYDTLSEAKKALKTWISEGTHITVVTQDEQPDPEPPAPKAPLPTAREIIMSSKQAYKRAYRYLRLDADCSVSQFVEAARRVGIKSNVAFAAYVSYRTSTS